MFALTVIALWLLTVIVAMLVIATIRLERERSRLKRQRQKVKELVGRLNVEIRMWQNKNLHQ